MYCCRRGCVTSRRGKLGQTLVYIYLHRRVRRRKDAQLIDKVARDDAFSHETDLFVFHSERCRARSRKRGKLTPEHRSREVISLFLRLVGQDFHARSGELEETERACNSRIACRGIIPPTKVIRDFRYFSTPLRDFDTNESESRTIHTEGVCKSLRWEK